MRRLAMIVLLLGGCRQILGIDDPQRTGDAPAGSPPGDGATDARRPGDGPHALDAVPPGPDAALPAGLVAEWRFDENTGATAHDDAPIDANSPSTLTATNNAQYTWQPGALDLSAGEFTSASTAVASAIHTSGTLSIELWLTSDAQIQDASVIGIFNGNMLSTGLTLMAGDATASVSQSSVGVASPSGLAQIVLTYDGDTVRMAVNGATSGASATIQNFDVPANNTVQLGGIGSVGQTFSRLRIFDRALTSTEIHASYVAGDGDP